MRRRICRVIILVLVGLVLAVNAAWGIDPVLQDAQRKLRKLGHDVGIADGLYGPRTRQAIEAFQREQQLPVSGILDAATLRALDHTTTPPAEEEPRVVPEQEAPLHVVLTYLRFYTIQPARVLPHVSEAFRGGLTPQAWIERTLQTIAAQDHAYLEWKIQRVDVTDTQATVQVHTRVRTKQQEHRRQETFGLRQTADGRWLIEVWRADVLPPATTTSQLGSSGRQSPAGMVHGSDLKR